jgi:hypothetical protein
LPSGVCLEEWGAQGLRLAPRLDIQTDGPTALRIGAMLNSGE